MRYRAFTDADHDLIVALERTVLLQEDPNFDALPDREKEGRIRTSVASLRFFERTEHSFVAEAEDVLYGAVFAQSVWHGDKPTVWISRILLHPAAPSDTLAGLLKACSKSAYDTAIYEVHTCLTPEQAAAAEGFRSQGIYAVRHLGSRSETAQGEKLA
ncbi:DUF1999 domain-containing protein [Deinococcus roseus]|uniref:GNAT family acetyltransferase n=1 Tax=Deinococcus roseus TaxID=392414 RepID=A0ABQ2D184_9DEIO|nr:DUF1999 domain-containing protein [Deinococcus roseus]GGJ41272.1 GNAT family acetyltransferase [Deinococcus roseus]